MNKAQEKEVSHLLVLVAEKVRDMEIGSRATNLSEASIIKMQLHRVGDINKLLEQLNEKWMQIVEGKVNDRG